MAKLFVVLLDDNRLKKLEGSGLEKQVSKLFGGALNAFNMEVTDEHASKILEEFATARIDSRGAITDVPIAFNRVVFEEIAKNKSLGPEVMEGVLARVAEIKEAAAKESEYLPAPDIDI
ncbi:MAG: hypothetical protein AB1374_02355 [Bacillota bacterium]